MIIINIKKGTVLADKVVKADTFFKRLKGLMLKKSLECGEGLLLSPCKSIHTFGMRFGIDVIYISKAGEIVKMKENILPGKIEPIVLKASYVLELPAGTIKKSGIELGDILYWQ